jgi:hypothetical protein
MLLWLAVQRPWGKPGYYVFAFIGLIAGLKFEPYTSKGVKKGFCGQVALRFRANEYVVKYRIL